MPVARPKVVFFGNERLATGVTTEVSTLKALLDANYDVTAVVVNNESSATRKQRQLEIESIARAHNIPLLSPQQPADIVDTLRSYDAAIGVLVAYGKIISQEIIDIFPRGIINIHPSLLPKHRGPTPIESVILGGESKTGVSIMQLSSGMDSGAVFEQSELTLSGSETKQELADALLNIGQRMIISLLPSILDGSVTPTPQDHSEASYDQLIKKQDGIIDWRKSADQIEREIRAYALWPKSRTTLGEIDVVIKSSEVYKQQMGNPGSIHLGANKELIIACGSGSLKIDRLQPAGKADMDAKAFLAGYHHRLSIQ